MDETKETMRKTGKNNLTKIDKRINQLNVTESEKITRRNRNGVDNLIA